jgi:hypothetical protein
MLSDKLSEKPQAGLCPRKACPDNNDAVVGAAPDLPPFILLLASACSSPPSEGHELAAVERST